MAGSVSGPHPTANVRQPAEAAATTADAAITPGASPPAADEALRHARRLLRSTILIDGHNDLPIAVRNFPTAPGDVVAYDLRQRTPGDTDIPRLRAGGLGGQFWSVYIPGEGGGPYARTQLEQIDLARRIIARYPDTFRLALRMKRYHTGGAGESIQALRRRAAQLQGDLGYGGYQIVEYTEGIDSQTVGARRVADGVIRLVQRREADSFLQNAAR